MTGTVVSLKGSVDDVAQEVAGNTKAIVSLDSRVPEMRTVAT
jgi:hypothetical protein